MWLRQFLFLAITQTHDSWSKNGLSAKSTNLSRILGELENYSLHQDTKTCTHILNDPNLENGRSKVFNFSVESPNQHFYIDKLHLVFISLRFEPTMNVFSGFVLKKLEDGSSCMKDVDAIKFQSVHFNEIPTALKTWPKPTFTFMIFWMELLLENSLEKGVKSIPILCGDFSIIVMFATFSTSMVLQSKLLPVLWSIRWWSW